LEARRPRRGEGILAAELAEVRMLSDRGRYNEARSLAQKLLDEHPSDADVHTAMGDVCSAEGMWNEAVRWYSASLELEFDPKVMEFLAAARARAVQSGVAPEQAPTVAMAERKATPEEADERRRVVPLAIAGVLLATLLLFFSIRWATTAPRDAGAAPEQSAPPAAPGIGQGSSAWAPTGPTSYGAASSTAAAQASPATVYPTTVTPGVSSEQRPGRPVRYTGQPPLTQRTPVAKTVGDDAASITGRDKRIVKQMHIEKFHEGTSVPDRAAATVDPYSGLAIITIRAPQTADSRRLEYEVVQAAFKAAMSAMKVDGSVRAIVVRCVTQIVNEQGIEEDVILFRGAFNRDNLKYWLGSTGRPSYQQISTSIITEAWWDEDAVSRYLGAQRDRIEQQKAAK